MPNTAGTGSEEVAIEPRLMPRPKRREAQPEIVKPQCGSQNGLQKATDSCHNFLKKPEGKMIF